MSVYTQSLDTYAAAGRAGLTGSDLTRARKDAAGAADRLAREHEAGTVPFMAAAAAVEDLDGIEAAAQDLASRFRHIHIIGTGGSSLGGKSLAALAEPGGPALAFFENADPGNPAMWPGRWLDMADRGFIVVSKSGRTAEVLALFSAFWQVAQNRLGPAAADHFTVVTEPGDNPLRRLAADRNMCLIDHPPGLGGRYSALSLVGLLPARLAGVDIRAVRAGAAEVLRDFMAAEADSAPGQGAAANAALLRAGAAAQVIMPYADTLGPFARWFCQIWGESLGKGGQGSLPYPAIGAVDQHSQLQLWLDGPPGAAFTLLSPGHDAGAGSGADPGATLAAPLDTGGALPWLDGHRLADLIAAQYRATAATLADRGRPVRTIDLAAPMAGPREVGALMMHFMLETVLTGYILGIDPFNQPAVEDGKQRTRKLLSGGGGED